MVACASGRGWASGAMEMGVCVGVRGGAKERGGGDMGGAMETAPCFPYRLADILGTRS